MKVKILSTKLIKPSSPTPSELQEFHISFTDEMSPTMNVPLILYYNTNKCNSADLDDTSGNLKQSLETSLARVLPQSYPLCGRYIKEDHLIDCSDQGVQYLEAQAIGISLHRLLETEVKPEELNHLLPCPFGAADEITDPLLSIQVTSFDCGGLAIGICISHRIADAATLSTFVSAWANACNLNHGGGNNKNIHPIFNSAQFFPGRNLPKLELGIPRTAEHVDYPNHGPNLVTRVFEFNCKAISELRSKVDNIKHRPTRVSLVSGLILRALLEIDAAKHGRLRPSLVLQTVNFRNRTSPPLPQHSCGNFCAFAVSRCTGEEAKSMEFEACVNMVGSAAKKTIAKCGKILSSGEDGHMVVIKPFKEVAQMLCNSTDWNLVLLNSWCSECGSKHEMPSLYPHAKGILHALKDKGIDVAVASRSSSADIANSFLHKLGLNSMFVAKEIYSTGTHKTEHFQRINQRTGVPYNAMLFFDDENRNIEAVSKMGVTSMLVDNGVDLAALREGLEKYSQNLESLGRNKQKRSNFSQKPGSSERALK